MLSALPHRQSQAGVTLVEILVTVVIISVGLLGVAALHTITLRNGQDAHIRTQATSMAHDIIDRMRANRDVAIAGGYDILLASDAPTITGTSPLSDRDKSAWLALLKSTLPGGDGEVKRSDLGGHTVFTITVQWGEHDNTLTFATDVEI